MRELDRAFTGFNSAIKDDAHLTSDQIARLVLDAAGAAQDRIIGNRDAEGCGDETGIRIGNRSDALEAIDAARASASAHDALLEALRDAIERGII
jgi:hypothetical protein